MRYTEKMVVKAVISDMDGTLIGYNTSYDPAVVPLISTLKESNIYFSVATGNAYLGVIARYIRELDVSPLNIFNGGGIIRNYITGEVPWSKTIGKSSIEYIARLFYDRGLVFSLETQDEAYMTSHVSTPAYVEYSPLLFHFEQMPKQIVKILLHVGVNKLPENIVDELRSDVMRFCKDVQVMKFHIDRWWGLDITSEKSTKHTAALELAKIIGVTREEMVGIGDSYNDYPLFMACGYKIAMGNAPKELKDVADFVAPPTSDGGMRIALEHILQKAL